jgi:hypothetical protein
MTLNESESEPKNELVFDLSLSRQQLEVLKEALNVYVLLNLGQVEVFTPIGQRLIRDLKPASTTDAIQSLQRILSTLRLAVGTTVGTHKIETAPEETKVANTLLTQMSYYLKWPSNVDPTDPKGPKTFYNYSAHEPLAVFTQHQSLDIREGSETEEGS